MLGEVYKGGSDQGQFKESESLLWFTLSHRTVDRGGGELDRDESKLTLVLCP